MIWVWLAIIVISAVIEALSWDMTSIWITCGGIITLIICACGAPIVAQIIPFVLISLICIIFLRPLAKKSISKNTVATNSSSLIGKRSKLIEEISDTQNGSIKINDIIWSAQSIDGSKIDKGKNVEIVQIKGNKLIVKLCEKKS